MSHTNKNVNIIGNQVIRFRGEDVNMYDIISLTIEETEGDNLIVRSVCVRDDKPIIKDQNYRWIE